MFYGNDSSNINFGIEVDSSSEQDFTVLILYSYSNEMYTVSPLLLNQRLDDGAYYCLTLVFDTPVRIYINGDLIPQTSITLRNIDFNFGVSMHT